MNWEATAWAVGITSWIGLFLLTYCVWALIFTGDDYPRWYLWVLALGGTLILVGSFAGVMY